MSGRNKTNFETCFATSCSYKQKSPNIKNYVMSAMPKYKSGSNI
jgi:hypothetical protein